MSKVLRCRDVGMDSDFVVHAETEEEVLKEAAQHAQTVHGVKEISEELVERVRSAIRDE